MDEEEIWKCPTHPSKRRRTGICPTCLRDRLVTLCPNCANVRPCPCCPAATTSSSSSSFSSSFSLFSSVGAADGVGSVGRVSNLIDSEPSFRRSRSLAIPFLRSRSRFTGNVEFTDQKPPTTGGNRGKSSLLSIFKTNKSKKGEEEKENEELTKTSNDYARMMNRSKSVSVTLSTNSGAGDVKSSSKGRGWYFPSPIRAFRQSKTSKVVQERSPMCRG